MLGSLRRDGTLVAEEQLVLIAIGALVAGFAAAAADGLLLVTLLGVMVSFRRVLVESYEAWRAQRSPEVPI